MAVSTDRFLLLRQPARDRAVSAGSHSVKIRRAATGSTRRARVGSSIWWPSKDQWRDEVEHMRFSVAIPNGLVDASNGRFLGKTDLGDGYTRWDWQINYPINSYNVSLNIGSYMHFADRLGDLTLDFYVLPESVEKAKVQFAQAKPMIEAYQMLRRVSVQEGRLQADRSAVFRNGAPERRHLWQPVRERLPRTRLDRRRRQPKFDFIIIHESAHEWFGNVSAADVSDMWIQEGWTTYLEAVVEHMFSTPMRSNTSTATSRRCEPGADHHDPRHPPFAVAGSVSSRARSFCKRSAPS